MKLGKEEMRRRYKESRKREKNGLCTNGTFVPTDVNDIPKDARIFKSRFVDDLRKVGE